MVWIFVLYFFFCYPGLTTFFLLLASAGVKGISYSGILKNLGKKLIFSLISKSIHRLNEYNCKISANLQRISNKIPCYQVEKELNKFMISL